jgi:hypothetical protein
MRSSAIATLAAAGMLVATVAMAQAPTDQPATPDQGTTSGPAAGSNVEPSAATAKKATHHRSHHKHKASAAAADSAGAPGEAAKQGSESGPAPDAPK